MTDRTFLPCIAVLALLCSTVADAAGQARVMLQVGAFPTQSEAEAAAARFKRANALRVGGVASEVHRADLGSRGTWYRVLVGPFADKPAADAVCGRLKAAGAPCFLAFVERGQASNPRAEPLADIANLPPWIVASGPETAIKPVPAQIKAAAESPPPAVTSEFSRLLRLAEEGDEKAQLQVAGFYRVGRGVARDEAQSLRWYRAAAKKGVAEAQFELGKAYDAAIGGPRDPFEAVRWYRLAAQQGYGRAQYNLGSMHGNGEGVPVDYLKAYMWFSISEATLSGPEREAARNAKAQAAQLMMPDDVSRALQMAQRCLTSAYQNCD